MKNGDLNCEGILIIKPALPGVSWIHRREIAFEDSSWGNLHESIDSNLDLGLDDN